MAYSIVGYNGKLFCYNGEHIFAYDPFNPDLSTFIDCSYKFHKNFRGFQLFIALGACQGFLRMISVCHGNVKAVAIGAIKDYPTWEWSLVDKVYPDRRIPCSRRTLMATSTLYDHWVSTQVMGISWWRSIKAVFGLCY
ncbi:hypothetical protein NC653_010243 [Populus alba x Populus x berolinensis]|uniref:Uncharacterized protein n=1 Tax=Populus alba x Populus x berolinensis TaxID=444605 RepID=A0AAD6QZD6_9ROSI|nr:hypothetical protein NC653_010230 [Populus alba x Populus x berolinensis]KAJ6999474.1 hypothetical protein NC653_010243 [Populus alba x Populus x berolinensis]